MVLLRLPAIFSLQPLSESPVFFEPVSLSARHITPLSFNAKTGSAQRSQLGRLPSDSTGFHSSLRLRPAFYGPVSKGGSTFSSVELANLLSVAVPR